MEFTFSSPDRSETKLDVREIERELGDGTWETLSSAIMVKVATWAVAWGVRVDDIEPGNLVLDSDEIEIGGRGDWKVEIAQLFQYFENELNSYQEPDVYLAYLSGQEWRYVDFDNIDDWTDDFQEEYPDDLEDWGRDRMADMGESLPDHLDVYFDYEKYAEDQLEGYNEYEWNGVKYLFSN